MSKNNADGLEAIILTREEVKILKKFLLKALNVTDKEYKTIYDIMKRLEEVESFDNENKERENVILKDKLSEILELTKKTGMINLRKEEIRQIIGDIK